jgi:hypothetical protein
LSVHFGFFRSEKAYLSGDAPREKVFPYSSKLDKKGPCFPAPHFIKCADLKPGDPARLEAIGKKVALV